MISRLYETFYGQIQGGGGTCCQDHSILTVVAEEGGKSLPEGQGRKTCLLCGAVNTAVDIHTDVVNILLHRLSHTRCLGEGSGGIV